MNEFELKKKIEGLESNVELLTANLELISEFVKNQLEINKMLDERVTKLTPKRKRK